MVYFHHCLGCHYFMYRPIYIQYVRHCVQCVFLFSALVVKLLLMILSHTVSYWVVLPLLVLRPVFVTTFIFFYVVNLMVVTLGKSTAC